MRIYNTFQLNKNLINIHDRIAAVIAFRHRLRVSLYKRARLPLVNADDATANLLSLHSLPQAPVDCDVPIPLVRVIRDDGSPFNPCTYALLSATPTLTEKSFADICFTLFSPGER